MFVARIPLSNNITMIQNINVFIQHFSKGFDCVIAERRIVDFNNLSPLEIIDILGNHYCILKILFVPIDLCSLREIGCDSH